MGPLGVSPGPALLCPWCQSVLCTRVRTIAQDRPRASTGQPASRDLDLAWSPASPVRLAALRRLRPSAGALRVYADSAGHPFCIFVAGSAADW